MQKSRRFATLFAALAAAWLVLAAPARTRQEQVASSPSSNASPLRPCKVAGVDEGVLCGRLSVFENREARAGRRIDLNVVVMPALEAGEKDAPLFDLQGGPGVAATAGAGLYATELREYRRHRDVVLVDQRGTGESNPLTCGEYEPAKYLGEMYPVEYVRDCRKKLERVADLTQYTTPVAMDDLDDVRCSTKRGAAKSTCTKSSRVSPNWRSAGRTTGRRGATGSDSGRRKPSIL